MSIVGVEITCPECGAKQLCVMSSDKEPPTDILCGDCADKAVAVAEEPS